MRGLSPAMVTTDNYRQTDYCLSYWKGRVGRDEGRRRACEMLVGTEQFEDFGMYESILLKQMSEKCDSV
jgi:hypothetical protein